MAIFWVRYHTFFVSTTSLALSNRNRLLSQKSNHYLNHGRTLSNLLTRVAHWI